MKNIILSKLKEIEQKYDVRILLAVEAGSRAWGFSSPDSDYDVRFVYVHPLDWYLSLCEQRDVIEEMDPDGVLDVSGWDLRKALGLLAKGNCGLAEWLASPIVYRMDPVFFLEINSLKNRYLRKVSAAHHYFCMAMNHDKRYLEKRRTELKRFLYHVRGLLAAKWIVEKDSFPPVPFLDLVKSEVKDDAVRVDILDLVGLKRQGKENDKVIVNDSLVEFAANTAERLRWQIQQLPATEATDYRPLDNLFRRTVCV